VKIGFTGSRTWKDRETIWEDLDAAYVQAQKRGEDLIVAWGVAKRGADLHVTQWVELMQRRGEEVVPDRHPPDRRKHGDRCYYVRNVAIVRSGIARLYAYIHDDSPGATQTLGLARTFGVPRKVRRRWGDDWDTPVTIGEERPIPGLEGLDV
jgi:hypothetical protein